MKKIIIITVSILFFTSCISQNVALNKPIKVSSLEAATYPGNYAVDGNQGTRWSSAYADPQWIYVDLGDTYDITNVNISWENARGKNYQLQVSDDANAWATFKTVTNNSSLVNNNTVSATGRYVRMYGVNRYTKYGYSIFELQVFGNLHTQPQPPPTIPPTTPPIGTVNVDSLINAKIDSAIHTLDSTVVRKSSSANVDTLVTAVNSTTKFRLNITVPGNSGEKNVTVRRDNTGKYFIDKIFDTEPLSQWSVIIQNGIVVVLTNGTFSYAYSKETILR